MLIDSPRFASPIHHYFLDFVNQILSFHKYLVHIQAQNISEILFIFFHFTHLKIIIFHQNLQFGAENKRPCYELQMICFLTT